MRGYGKPWVMGSMSSMSSTSGLNLGPLLGLLLDQQPAGPGPAVQPGHRTSA